MPKQTLEIEVPEGYKAVDLRPAKYGDVILTNGVPATITNESYRNDNLQLILEKVRWRANRGGRYWYISLLAVVEKFTDRKTNIDNTFYEVGNYYQTEEEAEAALVRVKKAYLG